MKVLLIFKLDLSKNYIYIYAPSADNICARDTVKQASGANGKFGGEKDLRER